MRKLLKDFDNMTAWQHDSMTAFISNFRMAKIRRENVPILENISVTTPDGVEWRYDDPANSSSSLCLSFWGICSRTVTDDGLLQILSNISHYEEQGLKICGF